MQVTLSADADGGFVVHSYAGDDWRDCRDHVRACLGLQRGERRDHAAFDRAWVNAKADDRSRNDDDAVRKRRALELWNESRDPRGTLAEIYLRSRALDLPDDLAGDVLRFHPRCPWRNECTGKTDFVPALIAAFRSLDDNSLTAIHRIALDHDGRKLGRRMLGIVQRSAVKLDNAITGQLAIGEGVETCMAARQLGINPTWALGSVGMISLFPVLPNVVLLRIIGEQDAASQRTRELCGMRWRRAGRQVRVIIPLNGSKDLNDTLMRGHAQ
jgi:hypothetical protein